MPDEPDQSPDLPELTPEQDREVRRLLADARHSEPIPVDVSARLDRVLADLAAQGTDHAEPDTSAPGTVVSLASRRRRRAASMLVAAAAVVAVGVGIDQLTHGAGTGSSSSSAGSADTAAGKDSGSGSGSRSAAKPEKQSPNESLDGTAANTPNAQGRLLDLPRAVPVRSAHFAADVARARRLTRDEAAYGDLDTRHRGFSCTPGDWGRGTFVPVRYDGRRGVLVLRAVRGDTQVADLFGCGSSQVLRSITLPAR